MNYEEQMQSLITKTTIDIAIILSLIVIIIAILWIDLFASIARKPDRPRITFYSHHRQGISLPTDRKTRIDFEKLALRIDFVRVCQESS